jgi:hypothetical protein
MGLTVLLDAFPEKEWLLLKTSARFPRMFYLVILDMAKRIG